MHACGSSNNSGTHGFEARIPLHARDRWIDPLYWIEYVQYNFKKMKQIIVFFTIVIFTISAQESLKLSTSEFDRKVMDQSNKNIINN